MTSFRKLSVVAVVPLLLTALSTTPAAAHGSMDSPPSRAVARGIDDWDNVRVADVRGKDRQRIPDGKLCSAGLAKYESLDVPDADGPVTTLSSGAGFTFKYRETIPHKGTFRLYVTKDGYDPAQPLAWSDLETRPFLTATDPASRNRAYVIQGKLPAGKTGRHLIYTIWQNSDTPDTYYSCSDVDFARADTDTAVAPGAPASSAAPAPPSSASSSAAETITETNTPQAVAQVSASQPARESGVFLVVMGAAAILAAAFAAFVLLRLRRRT